MTALILFAQEAVALTSREQWVINVFFGVIALVSIASALKMVTTDNVVHAALYLLSLIHI